MGSGASAENARATVSTALAGKPADASDVKDLEAAKAEIRQLRKMALDFQNQLRDEMKAKAGNNGAKKREAVMDKGAPEQKGGAENYVAKVFPKSQDIKELLLGIVTTNILFSSYANEEHNAIVDAFNSERVSSGTFVIRQGDSGDKFYVVESGSLDIFVKTSSGESKVGNQLGPGSAFGELALMYNTPRAASVKASSDCVLWAIDRATYRGILVYYKYIRNKQYMEFLRKVEIMGKQLGVVMSESKIIS